MPAEVLHQLCRAGIIETKPINQRAIGGQAKQPRLFVSALRLVGNRAYLNEAETQRRQRVGCRAIFVKAGRQSDRVRELEPETFQCAERRTFMTASKQISDWIQMQK